MTTTTEANAYLRTQVMTASPEQLRLMLLDGSIRFLQQAIDGLNDKDYEASYNGITQARAIVLELATSVSTEVDHELAERVRSVYMYLYRELIDASLNRDLPRLEKPATCSATSARRGLCSWRKSVPSVQPTPPTRRRPRPGKRRRHPSPPPASLRRADPIHPGPRTDR